MKKLRTRLAACAATMALLLGMTAGMPVMAAQKGDLNSDGTINAADALVVLQASVQLQTLDKDGVYSADVSYDGEVNASDALLILQYSVALIQEFTPRVNQSLSPWDDQTHHYSQTMEAVSVDGIRTYYQTAYPYTGVYNFEADAIMAYCANLSWANEENRYLTWVKSSGKRLAIMIQAGGAGMDDEYFADHPDLAADPEMAYGDVFADIEGFTDYKWSILDVLCSKYSPEAVCVEEPHWQKRGGRSELFKQVYRETYGEDWVDPDFSAEARWKSSKLKGQLLETFIQTLGERVKEKYPEVKFFVATHSTIGYNQWDHVDDISAYAAMDCVDAIIGQSWSDPQINVYPYGGGLKRQVFEQGYLAYAGFAALAGEDIDLFTLTDPKIDTPADYTWEDFETWCKSAVTAQLLQQKVHRFQQTIWPERSFADDTPDDYKTVQLNIFAALNDLNGSESTLYAGTPGISVGMSDTLTWQSGNFMAKPNSNYGFCGLTIPLIEKGIPLGVTALDLVESADDLEGVRMLILSYDCMKPKNEQVNSAIAQWVRDGGVLLYVGGHDDFETIEDEWWQKEYGMTPLEHLLSELELDITVGGPAGMSELEWTGEDGYCTSFDGKLLMNGLDLYTATFTGSGYTSILEASGDCVGLTAKAGLGRVILLGTSSPIFTNYEDSPAMMREITEYACRYTGLEYLENDYMAVSRGRYLSAQGMTDGQGGLLKGDFVDLFDPSLPVVDEKTIAAGESVLLYDLSELRTEGIPRLAYAGADLLDEPVEQENQTTLSVSVPTGATASIRVLQNGRRLADVSCMQGDRRLMIDYTVDEASDSALLRLTASTDNPYDITLYWVDP